MNSRAKRMECVQLAGALARQEVLRRRKRAPRIPNASRGSVAAMQRWGAQPASAASSKPWTSESRALANGDAPITLNVAYRKGRLAQHPVILMLGSLPTDGVPDWSTNLVSEGYMLVAFAAAHPPDPDPARR